MKRGASGTYEVTTTTGEAVRAFVPAPLPPKPEIDLSGDRLRQLERAQLACGRLDGVSALLPDPDLFLYAYVRREALLSSQIEGTQSSLSDLLLFEMEEAPGVPFDDVVEVSNYVAALEHGVERLRGGFPLSNRLLREVHGKLLARGRGAERSPGEFRRTQNWIGGTRPGNAHYVPPPPGRVQECMAALERFLHDEGSRLPILVQAAVAHVQFETIHPFLDGNGRVGRLLVTFLLTERRLLDRPVLYLSHHFKRRRREYYVRLQAVRDEGDWEGWLAFFLEGVAEVSREATATAAAILRMREEYRARIVERLGRAAANGHRILERLFDHPIVTVARVRQWLGVTPAGANNLVNRLAAIGVLREITGFARNRRFRFDPYLRLFEEPEEQAP